MGRQYVERTQDFRGQIRPVIGERLHQAAPAFPVRAGDGFGLAGVAPEDYGGAIAARGGGGGGAGKTPPTPGPQAHQEKKTGDARGGARWPSDEGGGRPAS